MASVHLTAGSDGTDGLGVALGYDLGGTYQSIYAKFELYWPEDTTRVWAPSGFGPEVFVSSPDSDPNDYWRGLWLPWDATRKVIPGVRTDFDSNSTWFGSELRGDRWHTIEYWIDGAAAEPQGWWKVDGQGGMWADDFSLLDMAWLFFGPTFFDGQAPLPTEWWVNRVQIGTAPGLADILDFDPATDSYATTFTPFFEGGGSAAAAGDPPNFARFDASAANAFAEMSTIAPSPSYKFKARVRVTPETLAALETDAFSSLLMKVGTVATGNDGLFLDAQFGHGWQYWTLADPTAAIGSFDGKSSHEIVCELTYDSGTLWNFVWKADDVLLFTDNGVDLGIDDTGTIDLFEVGGAGGGPGVAGEVYEVLWVEVRDDSDTVVFSDDFASGDFTAWDGTSGTATVESVAAPVDPTPGTGSVKLNNAADPAPPVARFDFSSAAAYATRTLPVGDLWVITLHAALAAGIDPADVGVLCEPDVFELEPTAGGELGLFPYIGSGFGWELWGSPSPFVDGVGAPPTPGVPFEIVLTVQWNGTNWDVTAVIDGTTLGPISTELGHDNTVPVEFSIGARYTSNQPGYAIDFFDVDVTDGTTTVFFDDFSGGDFSAWDSVVGVATITSAGGARILGLAYMLEDVTSLYARVEMLFPSAALESIRGIDGANVLGFQFRPSFDVGPVGLGGNTMEKVALATGRPGPARFVGTAGDASIVVNLDPSAIGYRLHVRLEIPQATLDGITPGGRSATLLRFGDTAVTGLYADNADISDWQWASETAGPLGAFVVADAICDFYIEVQPVTGTLWDVTWYLNDNIIFGESSIDLGVDGTADLPLLLGAINAQMTVDEDYLFHSAKFVVHDLSTTLLEDDFHDFANWGGPTGDGTIDPAPIGWATGTPGKVAAFDGSASDSYVSRLVGPTPRYWITAAVQMPAASFAALASGGSTSASMVAVGDLNGFEDDVYSHPANPDWTEEIYPRLAVFDGSGSPSYAETTVNPDAGIGTVCETYKIKVRLSVPLATQAAITAFSAIATAWLISIGLNPASGSTSANLYEYNFGGWKWQVNPDTALLAPQGSAGGGFLHVIEATLTYVSGTLWNIDWRWLGNNASILLFSDTNVDLGVDNASGMPFAIGAITPGYGVGETYIFESVEVRDDTDAIIFSEDFFDVAFSAWDSFTGATPTHFSGLASPLTFSGPTPDVFAVVELILEHEAGTTWNAYWTVDSSHFSLILGRSIQLPNDETQPLELSVGAIYANVGIAPQTYLVHAVTVRDQSDVVIFEEGWDADFSQWDTSRGRMEVLGAKPTPDEWHVVELWWQAAGDSYLKVDDEIISTFQGFDGTARVVIIGPSPLGADEVETWINRVQVSASELGSDLVSYDPNLPNVIADTFIVAEDNSDDLVELDTPPEPPPGPSTDAFVSDIGADISDSLVRVLTRVIELEDVGATIDEEIIVVPMHPVALFDASEGNTWITKEVGPTTIYKFEFELAIPTETFSNIMDDFGGEFTADVFQAQNVILFAGDIEGVYFTMDFNVYNIWRAIVEQGSIPTDQFGTKFIPDTWTPIEVIATWDHDTFWQFSYTILGSTWTNEFLTDLLDPAEMMVLALGSPRFSNFSRGERYYFRNVVVKDGADSDTVIFEDDFALGTFDAKGWTQHWSGGANLPAIVSDPFFLPLPGINRAVSDTLPTVVDSISTLRTVVRYLSDTGATVSDAILATPSVYYPTPSGGFADILGDLQPELQVVEDVQMPVLALAYELGRLEQQGYSLLNRMFPSQADDVLGTLPLWEELLALPVRPAGVSLEVRVRAVKAAAKSRHVPSNHGWVDLITEILGSSSWSFSQTDATVTVHIFGGGTEYSIGQVTQIIRRVTPAHLAVTVI